VLARGTEILAKAAAEHSAVPAFATYNLEMVQAVVAAADQTGRPVIVLAGSSHFNHAGRSALISIALQAARDSTATIGVHLDHYRDLAEIEQCVRAGYSSVMVDGSHLSFEDNVKLTRAAVALAHPAGAWVEAELGAVPGDEDVSIDAAPAQAVTDPLEAADFVEMDRRGRARCGQCPRPHHHTGVPRPGTAGRDQGRPCGAARAARRQRST
jgi:tagatose 1,6-diphosphate aldolase GatY/KbaY